MKVPFADLFRQFKPLVPEIQIAMNSIIERCAFINGPEVQQFERHMAKWIGLPEVCGVSNCTQALEMTMQALAIGPGDEVITVPNTAFPTTEAINLTGARVVFADITPGYFSIDPAQIEKKITSKTKAIIPVHLYGIPADMNAILAIAKKHSLYVIEDCAQAQGARYKGTYVGTMGTASCFSFFPSKNLGTFGDGGAMASADTGLIKKVRMIANHGRIDKYSHLIVGTNSRLDTFKAAQLSICLNHLDAWNQQRRDAAVLYEELLTPYKGIKLPRVPEGCEAIWHVYAIRHAKRDELTAYLKKQGIDTGLHYPMPLHFQPVYESMGLQKGSLPEAEAACAEVLSLPMFPGITDDEIQWVSKAIGDFCKQ
ncbi:MAG: DegT/DnrJ/EryC1/StrS family aminotransferase [Pseudomonadota bacterium]